MEYSKNIYPQTTKYVRKYPQADRRCMSLSIRMGVKRLSDLSNISECFPEGVKHDTHIDFPSDQCFNWLTTLAVNICRGCIFPLLDDCLPGNKMTEAPSQNILMWAQLPPHGRANLDPSHWQGCPRSSQFQFSLFKTLDCKQTVGFSTVEGRMR